MSNRQATRTRVLGTARSRPRHWSRPPARRLTALAGAAFLLAAFVTRTSFCQQNRFATEDSRSEYVHWIELRDTSGNVINPADPNAPPYSPRHTCGKCHDYEAISQGHHFNQLLGNTPAGRPGEPLIWTDLRTGTQLPLSYRGWPGTYKPAEVGLTCWDVVLKFGGHLPGGGPGEPPKEALDQTPAATAGGSSTAQADSPSAGAGSASSAKEQPAQTGSQSGQEAGRSAGTPQEPTRWKLSGSFEIDCLICHSAGGGYSTHLRAAEVEKQNLAWAPTVAAALADVKGSVKTLPDSFDPSQPSDPNRPGPKLPQTVYRQGRFVESNKVLIEVVRRPPNSACYYCHTNRIVGPDAPAEWTRDEDVHVEAGLACADCHRNGLAHHTVRGFEGEQHPTGESVESFTCRGCHLGSGHELAARGGHFAAPHPLHKGLPPLHFDKLTCTACHSGPVPGEKPLLVQTSLAHDLGQPGHRHADDPPQIVAPVFLKNKQGQLAPYRLVWAAFWGLMKGDQVEPLNPEQAYKELRRVLRVRRDIRKELVRVRLSTDEKAKVLGKERASVPEFRLTEEEKQKLEELLNQKRAEGVPEKLAAALADLAKKHPDATPVYVASGKVYRLAADGKSVEEFDHPAAEPYAWPLAHDVRPAAQALGAGGCTDCHSDSSPLFYATLTALGPLPDRQPKKATFYELQGFDAQLLSVWNLSFRGRSAFKWFGFVATGLTGLVLLVALLVGLNGLVRLAWVGRRSSSKEAGASSNRSETSS